MKSKIRNQIIAETLANKFSVEVVNKDMYEYIELAGDNVQDRWEAIFAKIYKKYPYLLNADELKVDDFIYSLLSMFSNKDIKRFNCEQIAMLGDVLADTILTFCKGYNEILGINQEEKEKEHD